MENEDFLQKKIATMINTKLLCPYCKNELTLKWIQDNIPYFGNVMYITANCVCKFRYNDTILLSYDKPSSYSLDIICEEDLNSKIIKSTSCTIEIKELGILVEPGPNSTSYITNIEGLLTKIKDVVSFATNIEKNDLKKYEHGKKIISTIEAIIQNPKKQKNKITLTLKDPCGNSKIINLRAKHMLLTKEEIEELNTGMIVLEK